MATTGTRGGLLMIMNACYTYSHVDGSNGTTAWMVVMAPLWPVRSGLLATTAGCVQHIAAIRSGGTVPPRLPGTTQRRPHKAATVRAGLCVRNRVRVCSCPCVSTRVPVCSTLMTLTKAVQSVTWAALQARGSVHATPWQVAPTRHRCRM